MIPVETSTTHSIQGKVTQKPNIAGESLILE